MIKIKGAMVQDFESFLQFSCFYDNFSSIFVNALAKIHHLLPYHLGYRLVLQNSIFIQEFEFSHKIMEYLTAWKTMTV